MRKREKDKQLYSMLEVYRHEDYFGICDTGMFSLTVMLCDSEGDGSG